ncbi:MAG: serine hydrolase domain-containing protein, partial [Candidatus Palauibacterales bacterium]|nr:serine hydrolase domain-containing protein [Candidatus Palauibacterales bacterium]
MSWDDAGGVTAAVFSGPSVIWSRSFGWADRAVVEQTRRSTVYRVGSITRSVTAVLLALLVQDGVVALEDPVREYLPALSELSGREEGQSPITFGQLASHTAGLVRETGLGVVLLRNYDDGSTELGDR